MKYIVHMGLPKTGSTSLQSALFDNRETNRLHGVVYPETGLTDLPRKKHAPLIKVLEGVAPERVGMPNDWIDRFHAEIAGADICIISAENLSNWTCEEFGNFANFFPRERTRVVMYMREPVSHVVSYYKHRVRIITMAMGLRDFAESFRLPWLNIAEQWADFLGRKNFVIRKYRSDDGRWDIVTDFMSLIEVETGYPLPTPKRPMYDMNTGIAGNCLFVKRVLNCFINKKEAISIRREMLDMKNLDCSFCGKIPVDKETVDLISNRNREYFEGIEKRFGLSIRPREKPVEAPPSPDLGKLAHDFSRILAWARKRDGAMAPLLERMTGMFSELPRNKSEYGFRE